MSLWDFSVLRERLKDYDLYSEAYESTPVVFENSRLKAVEGNFFQGAGLRIVKNGRIGFASGSDPARIGDLCGHASETSGLGEESFFLFPGERPEKKDLDLYDPDVEALEAARCVEWGRALIDRFLKRDGRLKVHASLDKHVLSKRLVNSRGLDLEEKKTLFSFSVSLFSARENDFLEIYDYRRSCFLPPQEEFDELERRLLFLYDGCGRKGSVKPGYMKVFFTPKAFAMLLEFLLRSFDAKLWEKKISFFHDKQGQRFIPQNIDVFDDPFLSRGVYSTFFDGDGLAPEKVYFIKGGIVQDSFRDLQTAGKMKQRSNGHSARSHAALPLPGMTNIEFEVHDDNLRGTREMMLKEAREGLFVDQLIGAGQSNILGGEFSANVDLGFLIQNGEIAGRVKNCMITGNLFDFFSRIIMAEDQKSVYSRCRVPGVLFDRISVAAG